MENPCSYWAGYPGVVILGVHHWMHSTDVLWRWDEQIRSSGCILVCIRRCNLVKTWNSQISDDPKVNTGNSNPWILLSRHRAWCCDVCLPQNWSTNAEFFSCSCCTVKLYLVYLMDAVNYAYQLLLRHIFSEWNETLPLLRIYMMWLHTSSYSLGICPPALNLAVLEHTSQTQ